MIPLMLSLVVLTQKKLELIQMQSSRTLATVFLSKEMDQHESCKILSAAESKIAGELLQPNIAVRSTKYFPPKEKTCKPISFG